MTGLRGLALGAACALALLGCGGGSSDGGHGTLNAQPVWPQPGGGTPSPQLPVAAQTVRIVFDSDGPPPLHCCLAVDPRTVPIDSATGLRLLLLDAPTGAATFMLAAFPGTVAPAPDSTHLDLCPTNPPGIGQPCEPDGFDTPTFQSPPQTVTILPGTGSPPINVSLVAVPFLLNLQPTPNDSVNSPVPVSFTAADAVTGIDQNSIAVEASFRSFSKRAAVTPIPCDDRTSTSLPCSEGGKLQASGFRITTAPLYLPSGPVTLHITVSNLASPPATLNDFQYDFTVADQGGTPSAEALSTVMASARTMPPASNRGPAGASQDAGVSGAVASSSTRQPTRTATTTPLAPRRIAATPTATCTPLARLSEGPS